MNKNNDVKVSIVMTSHNRPDYLKTAIDSILNQTMPDWELIIIDDCSTEPRVMEVLSEAKKDHRIRPFKTNYDADRISVSWNLGLDLAKGKYIALLDDDNMKAPTFCQEMSDYLDEHIEFDGVACYNAIMRMDKLMNEVFDAPKYANKENMKARNHIDSGCAMFRKSVIDKIGWFDERLTTQEDWDYFKRIFLHASGFGVIEKPLSIFRWHGTNRQYSHKKLGGVEQEQYIISGKNYNTKLRLMLFHQEEKNITLSQNNVLRGLRDALKAIDWIEVTDVCISRFYEISTIYDMVICFAPFTIDLKYIKTIQYFGNEIIHFHIEDPQAFSQNSERAKTATYIFTNDISVQNEYEKIIGKGRVGYCPSISLNDISLKLRDNVSKKNDVVFLGHPYESRIKFITELAPKIKNIGYGFSLIGEGWSKKGIGCPCVDEVSEQKALELMEESKIVVLYNRRNSDLGGKLNSIKPKSTVRGYFECASGSLIMIDDDRKNHNFNGGMVFYSNTDDLVEKIDYYMKNPTLMNEKAKTAKETALRDFTYRTRINSLMNAIRSKRYYYEVR